MGYRTCYFGELNAALKGDVLAPRICVTFPRLTLCICKSMDKLPDISLIHKESLKAFVAQQLLKTQVLLLEQALAVLGQADPSIDCPVEEFEKPF